MISRAGIFAAGEGSRLKKDFPGLIKPMIPVSGKPLVEWMVVFLKRAGIKKITILLNSKGMPAKNYLTALPELKEALDFIIKDTASSWESFSLLSKICL